MNEFNVLLAAATNGTPSGSLFDALFARYIAPQESWRELESPLPITILAAGEDLIDYRIFGNTENGESVGERTENLFDKNAKNPDNGFIDNSYMSMGGDIHNISTCYISEYIELENITSITFAFTPLRDVYTCFYNSKKQITGQYDGIIIRDVPKTVTVPSSAKYMRMTIIKSVENKVCVVEGSTAPSSYIPYGYKLPMSVSDGVTTTTTPIYIGSDPLAEDEYVDYGTQKIYKDIDGTLIPTDPPVPIPALPTIQGETIIDYNPSTTPAVEPEKMYIKYKPQ